jgi:hypothetical protein
VWSTPHIALARRAARRGVGYLHLHHRTMYNPTTYHYRNILTYHCPHNGVLYMSRLLGEESFTNPNSDHKRATLHCYVGANTANCTYADTQHNWWSSSNDVECVSRRTGRGVETRPDSVFFSTQDDILPSNSLTEAFHYPTSLNKDVDFRSCASDYKFPHLSVTLKAAVH